MRYQLNASAQDPLPFLLALTPCIDEIMYDAAMYEAQKLADSYDPITQTSVSTIYAGGSHLTYSDTHSGLMMTNTDDARQSDT